MAVRIGGVGARIYVPQLYVYACMYVLHDVHTWHVYTLSRGSRVLKNTKYMLYGTCTSIVPGRKETR